MASLDLWILAALGLFAAIGYYTGAISQLSHLIGMAAAYLCARPLAAALAPALASRMGWPPAPTATGLSVFLMPVILICAALISRGMLNAVVPGDQRSTPDRLAGLVLGAGKAGVIAWVALCVVLAFEQPLAQRYPAVKDALGASSAAAFARGHALFSEAPTSVQEKLRELSAMRGDPKMARALLENPQIKKLLSDPELAKKLEAMKAR